MRQNNHRLNDPSDPVRHDVSGVAAQHGIWRRGKKWLVKQDADTQSRFCCHTSYVGKDGALSFLCPVCVEFGYARFEDDYVFDLAWGEWMVIAFALE